MTNPISGHVDWLDKSSSKVQRREKPLWQL